MESPFALFLLSSFLLLASTTDARTDPGEYWQGIMKDQPMPEAIQGLVHRGSVLSMSNKRTNCHTPADVANKDQPFKEFEPRPSASAFLDDATPSATFVKDIEPKPSVTAYLDDTKPSAFVKEKSVVKGSETGPIISSSHDDDVGLKEEKSYVKDFEPRPNLSAYQD